MKKHLICTAAVVFSAMFCTQTAVAQGCNNNTPGFGKSLDTVSFKTSQTWKIGYQEWSDVVVAKNCQKTTFAGDDRGSYNADCRSNEGHGDLFSWCAIARFQDELCPNGWRAPTADDFAALDKILSDSCSNDESLDKYVNAWGGGYGGYCASDGTPEHQDLYAYYWSKSEYSANYGYYMYLYTGGIIYPKNVDSKSYGYMFRCVR